MAREILVDFNALPRSIRERIIDSTGPQPKLPPLLAALGFHSVHDLYSTRWILFGFAPMLPCFLSMSHTFEENGPLDYTARVIGPAGPWFTVAWWGAVFFLTALGTQLIVHHMRRAALPFHPGRYLFPTHIVDARSQQLRIIPLNDLTEIKTTTINVDGNHDTTSCIFLFREGDAQKISVRARSKADVDACLQMFERVRANYAKAQLQQDTQSLRQLDLFFDVREKGLEAFQHQSPNELDGGPLARNVPGFTQKRWLQVVVLSLVLGPSSFLLARALGETAAFNRTRAKGTAEAFHKYTEQGWFHLEEAKELGAQANYQACEKNDRAACWRGFMNRWSDSPRLQEVRDERLPRAAFTEASGTVSGLREFLQRYPNSVVDAEARSRLAAMLGSETSSSEASSTSASSSSP